MLSQQPVSGCPEHDASEQFTRGSEVCWDTKTIISPHSVPRMWDFLSPQTLTPLAPLLGSVRRATDKLTSCPGKAGCPSTTTLPRAAPLGWELACAWHSFCSFHTSLCSQPALPFSQFHRQEKTKTWRHEVTRPQWRLQKVANPGLKPRVM